MEASSESQNMAMKGPDACQVNFKSFQRENSRPPDDVLSLSTTTDTTSVNQSNTLSTADPTDEEMDEEMESRSQGASSFRRFCYDVVRSRLFDAFILAIIFLNTVTLSAQTFKQAKINASWQLSLLDTVFLSVYLFELFLKLFVWRIRYFKNGWNIFDFIIVLASFADLLVALVVSQFSTVDTKAVAVLRIFRVVRAIRALRVLRTIRFLRHLQIIVTTLLKSIPAMGSIVILIALILYIFAIIGRGLYGEVDPNRFGNIGRASFTLFQLITLDDWFYMFSDVATQHPSSQHILVFLFVFIVCETFVFINLFIAVIVDSLSRTQAAAAEAEAAAAEAEAAAAEAEAEGNKEQTASKPEASQETHEEALNEKLDRQALAIEDYFTDHHIPEKQLKSMGHYCALLAALEHNVRRDEIQRSSLDELVDLLDIAKQ